MSPRQRVRDEPSLPDAAVVVRGGAMRRAAMEASAGTTYEQWGFHAISVFAHPSDSASEIRNKHFVLSQYEKVRVSSAGRLRSAGFDLLPTGSDGHYSVVLPSPPTDEAWRRLDRAFDVATTEL